MSLAEDLREDQERADWAFFHRDAAYPRARLVRLADGRYVVRVPAPVAGERGRGGVGGE